MPCIQLYKAFFICESGVLCHIYGVYYIDVHGYFIFLSLIFTVFGIVIYEVILTIPYWHLPVGLVEEKAEILLSN